MERCHRENCQTDLFFNEWRELFCLYDWSILFSHALSNNTICFANDWTQIKKTKRKLLRILQLFGDIRSKVLRFLLLCVASKLKSSWSGQWMGADVLPDKHRTKSIVLPVMRRIVSQSSLNVCKSRTDRCRRWQVHWHNCHFIEFQTPTSRSSHTNSQWHLLKSSSIRWSLPFSQRSVEVPMQQTMI